MRMKIMKTLLSAALIVVAETVPTYADVGTPSGATFLLQEVIDEFEQRLVKVAEQLQAAVKASSSRRAKRAIADAKRLLQQLPETEITRRLRWRLEDAMSAGLTTDEGKEALDEAAETAQVAVRLLRLPPPAIDPNQAQATLQAVLNSAEFRDPWAKLKRWWERLKERIWRLLEKPLNWLGEAIAWVGRHLAHLFEPLLQWIGRALAAIATWLWGLLGALLQISPVLTWFLIALLGLVVLYAVAVFLWRWWQGQQKAVAHIEAMEALATPEQLLREADLSAQAGDYLAALRKSYCALLLFLERLALIRFREQRTNWEYLAEIQRTAPSEVTQIVQEATTVFDHCFYALYRATADDFTAVKQRAVWLQQLRQVTTK